MKNVLYTVFLPFTFLSCILSFANKGVAYEAPADAEAANNFELRAHGRKAISTCSEMITAGFAESIVYK